MRERPPKRASLSVRAVTALYTAVAVLLLPLWLLILSRRRLRLPLGERLGRVPAGSPHRKPGAGCVLTHAASAGDVQAVIPLLRQLRAHGPELHLVLTTQTRSGRALAKALELGLDVRALPVDAWPWVDRFVAELAPNVVVLEYLELWPRLLRKVKAHGATVILQNARLHPRRRGRYASGFYRELLSLVDFCTARSASDAAALGTLGVQAEVFAHSKHTTLAGQEAPRVRALLAARGLSGLERESTWLAGSLHVEEADAVLRAQVALGSSRQLLLVPRYPEHGAAIAEKAARLGLSVRRLAAAGVVAGDEQAQVHVVETVGELRTLYAAAAVALVGGTLCRRGGQNPLEAAVAGCAVVVGPHTDQIHEELQALNGGFSCDAEGLAATLECAFQVGGETSMEAVETLVLDAQRGVEKVAAEVLRALTLAS